MLGVANGDFTRKIKYSFISDSLSSLFYVFFVWFFILRENMLISNTEMLISFQRI